MRPDAPEPWLHLSAIRYAQGRFDEAIELADAGITHLPNAAVLHDRRGHALKAAGRLDEAIVALERAVALAPEAGPIRANLGNALLAAERLEESIETLTRAVELSPESAEANLSLGNALKSIGAYDSAVARFRRALELKPRFAEAHFNIGNALRDAGRFTEAIEAYEAAIAVRPGYGDAHWNMSMALLHAGDLPRGWAEYEWRWREGDTMRLPEREGIALWRGEPVAGRRMLIWREQGLGDELLFLSCVGDLLAAGASLTLLVSARLVGLVARAFPAARVLADAPGALAGEGFDYHAPLGSLPRWLRATRAAFTGGGRFLRADQARLAMWQARLTALGPGRKVGWCWRSGLLTPARARHYAPLAAWTPVLTVPGVVWVNLQYDDCAAELAVVEGATGVAVHRWAGVDLRDDLEGVAALVSALDGVVSAPTAVGSLAGAVGTPTWQVESGNDWTRFGEAVSPWFGSLRSSLREPAERDWTGVMRRVAADLEAWAKAAGA
jgi:Flp pilus assembly protein TadD